jgi:hypothetical protein
VVLNTSPVSPFIMHHHFDALKAAAGFGFSVVSWVGGQIAQANVDLPDWVKSADTPLVILGLGYGVVHLWRELRAERNARISDRDSYIGMMRTDADKAAQSRENLLRATETQTGEFRALRREIARNGGVKHANDDG